MQPPAACGARRPCAFIFRRPDVNGNDTAAIFQRGSQSGVVAEPEILAEPENATLKTQAILLSIFAVSGAFISFQ